MAPYYNPRFDPELFMDGPLSKNPATRLRQMLARPGIVVCGSHMFCLSTNLTMNNQVAPGICDGISARCALEAGFECLYQRWLPSSLSNTYQVQTSLTSGAATTASRLGQPDLAIATLNDFVQVCLKQTLCSASDHSVSCCRREQWLPASVPQPLSSPTLILGTRNISKRRARLLMIYS